MMRARYGTGGFLKKLSVNAKIIEAFSFFNFDDLTSIRIPDSVILIKESAFACCYNLAKATLGNRVEIIGNQAFSHCYSLDSIDIPKSVRYIGKEAFRSCEKLGRVVMGNNVKRIEDFAFYKCPNVVIFAPRGSYAEGYARANNLKFMPL